MLKFFAEVVVGMGLQYVWAIADLFEVVFEVGKLAIYLFRLFLKIRLQLAAEIADNFRHLSDRWCGIGFHLLVFCGHFL